MKTSSFRYPKSIRFAKTLCNFFAILSLPILVLFLFTQSPGDFNSFAEYVVAMLSVPFVLIFGSVSFSGSWSDIDIVEDGLIIEFLWLKLKVPWKDIISIKHIGSRTFGITLITTNNKLTFFHRLYSLWASFSFLPGFYIHPVFISSTLLETIHKKTLKRKS